EVHRQFLQKRSILSEKRRERAAKKIQAIVRSKLDRTFWDDSAHQTLNENLKDLKLSPNQVADQLWLDFKKKKESIDEG
ncbi:hypothetical protein MJD09_09965, partial [bacterium]|nr:hypothetical protein [bacterium]